MSDVHRCCGTTCPDPPACPPAAGYVLVNAEGLAAALSQWDIWEAFDMTAQEFAAAILAAIQAAAEQTAPGVKGSEPLDVDLREAAGLLADACRRYFEGEAKAVVNIQPLVERIERNAAAYASQQPTAEETSEPPEDWGAGPLGIIP